MIEKSNIGGVFTVRGHTSPADGPSFEEYLLLTLKLLGAALINHMQKSYAILQNYPHRFQVGKGYKMIRFKSKDAPTKVSLCLSVFYSLYL